MIDKSPGGLHFVNPSWVLLGCKVQGSKTQTIRKPTHGTNTNNPTNGTSTQKPTKGTNTRKPTNGTDTQKTAHGTSTRKPTNGTNGRKLIKTEPPNENL